MELIGGLATVVALIADFSSQRRSGKEASLEDFKAWLAEQRHHEIIKLLESNLVTIVSMKAVLNESHSRIVDLQRQLEMLKRDQPATSLVQTQAKSDAIEVIYLGSNNKFVGTDRDLDELATRCAVHTIEGKVIEFTVLLQETVLNVVPDDPLIIPRYEKHRAERARRLKYRLELLTSQDVHEWWEYFLGRKEYWISAIKALLSRADISADGNVTGLTKIDVWRTDKPGLSAPVYLNKNEISVVLDHLGFDSTADLRFGADWRSAIDLPIDIIVGHIIPSIIVHFDLRSVSPDGNVLDLATWHIGEG
ncbi:hypothetical protein ACQQ2N_11745 [Dokdonella sp. MW10]|uniref:hypothetical protein n=1 Tax=Dokdonella sp. MW10 TaxID=2992926 RepID=UPI003F7DC5FF